METTSPDNDPAPRGRRSSLRRRTNSFEKSRINGIASSSAQRQVAHNQARLPMCLEVYSTQRPRNVVLMARKSGDASAIAGIPSSGARRHDNQVVKVQLCWNRYAICFRNRHCLRDQHLNNGCDDVPRLSHWALRRLARALAPMPSGRDAILEMARTSISSSSPLHPRRNESSFFEPLPNASASTDSMYLAKLIACVH